MFRRIAVGTVVLLLIAVDAARSEEPAGLDWSAWRRMPVFHAGRQMPLDTFARLAVRDICGREKPTLELAAALDEADVHSLDLAGARTLFPDGGRRKFESAELLFSWLVEPEKWERVPFLHAEHEQLRRLLDVPLRNSQGRRLKFVSPHQIKNARGEALRAPGIEEKVRELNGNYHFFRRLSAGSGVDEAVLKRFKSWMAEKADTNSELMRRARQLQSRLYDDGHPLRMAPGLDPTGLAATSRESDDVSSPWLSFNTMVLGSVELLCIYVPERDAAAARAKLQEPLRAVKDAFAEAKEAYRLDRGDPDRRARFAAATAGFEAAVRALGEAVEPFRRRLPAAATDENQDEKLHARLREQRIVDTAYPAVGAMDVEVHYNEFAPFLWSWIASLAAVFLFALSFGVIRGPMYFCGLLVLAAAQVLMTYGLALRYAITGWIPVTNMFESVVFVALTVSLLGLWFAVLPLLLPGLRGAWGLTALPGISGCRLLWKSRDAERDRSHPVSAADEETPSRGLSIANWAVLVPLVCLMIWVFRALAVEPYGTGGENAILRLWPRTAEGSWFPSSAGAVLTWGAGLCMLVLGVWYLPRIALTLLVSLITVPYSWIVDGVAEALREMGNRKVFVAVGAAVACFASILAFFAPVSVIDPKIGTLRPALHSNFWLTFHVLPITASYGAGALAWGLGNIAMTYYLFGRYRSSGKASGPSGAKGESFGADDGSPAGRVACRAPEPCAALARFIYTSILVAVLLLTAGTILGALWADVAWGRFWGWDAKEVWSLITILAYMIVLHGRYVRWFGDFGLAVGAVLGATAIVWAWYGVNYLLPGGLHSYGAGSGGQAEVLTAIALNWLYIAAAAVRYNVAIRRVGG